MKSGYDRWLLTSVSALLMVGLLMVASASMVISDRQYGYPFHYLLHQTLYLSLGVALAWVMTRIPLSVLQKVSGYLLLVSLLLLVLVLIPGIGKMVNGSRRWIHIGWLSIQVSEIAKLCSIVYLASYLQRYQEFIRHELRRFLKPMLLLALLAALLLLEPDFGAVAVITVTFLLLLFIAGVRLWPFFILFLLVIVALSSLAIIAPYRLERLTTFLNPWHTPFSSGYQLTQSLMAFGRGGLWGVGLGNSVQKLFYLPEAHTDFLFAVLAEEWGLVGTFLVISLFAVMVARIFSVGWRAEKSGNEFAAYVAYGFALWIGLQSMINMGVNVGLLPTKGLTLPLVSYGGSSLLMNCILVGIVLRISYENSMNMVQRRFRVHGVASRPSSWVS
ncbi:MAG: cell division protein FtsW [Coxiella sp. RIFCSPHIGHO2_12_FULL_44_14]|nr:MAG: cell division protein FtsW [Coxiella sp. RIFCSPHIGHO2_12_FULL_44_14]